MSCYTGVVFLCSHTGVCHEYLSSKTVHTVKLVASRGTRWLAEWPPWPAPHVALHADSGGSAKDVVEPRTSE